MLTGWLRSLQPTTRRRKGRYMDGHGDLVQMAEALLLQENEQQEEIDRLTHQGMDEAGAGCLEEAEATFSRALALAREHQYPRWEAQVLYYAGFVFVQNGNPALASSYVERALALFEQHGPLQMTASIGVFLAHVYNKTGQPERAFTTLKQALQWIQSGLQTEQISLYPLFEAYHELGHTYQLLELFPEATRVFEDARALARDLQSAGDERTILSDLIGLYLDTGDFTRAIELGERALAETDVSQSAPFAFLAAVSYNLGRAYAAAEEWEISIDRTRAAYAYLRAQTVSSTPRSEKRAEASAFIGQILVNIGTSYSGLGNAARTTDFAPAAIAHWRAGEEYLARAAAHDVEVPRRNLALTQQHLPSRAYQALIRASEPLFQSLCAEIEGTALAEERESSITKGKHALVRKQYAAASEHFMHALERDPFDLSPGRHWHAYSRLFRCHWHKDLVEVAECFDLDSQGARDVAMTSLLFAQWCKMAQYPTVQAYLAATRTAFKLTASEDPVDRLEKFAQKHGNRAETLIYAAMMQYLRGNHEECLKLLTGTGLDAPRLAWCCAFWQAMTAATCLQEEKARALIEEALTKGMPPTLLGPLRWLKASDATPTSFFMLVVRPLFICYALPYGEERAYHTDEDSTLPSRVRRIKEIRKGLLSTSPTPDDREYQGPHVLNLTGIRGPGGEAYLVYIEFDAVATEQGETELWPTTFAICYPTTSGEIAEWWQEYWINYAPGREQATLVDRGFQRLSLSLDPVGRDYERGSWTRGGHYWADPGPHLHVEELGTPTRFDRLPRGTLAYLQKVLEEAIPHVEIFCEACSNQTKRVGNVWCQHIFWCEKCQQISSPLERSRKMMGQSDQYCSHRFPKEAL